MALLWTTLKAKAWRWASAGPIPRLPSLPSLASIQRRRLAAVEFAARMRTRALVHVRARTSVCAPAPRKAEVRSCGQRPATSAGAETACGHVRPSVGEEAAGVMASTGKARSFVRARSTRPDEPWRLGRRPRPEAYSTMGSSGIRWPDGGDEGMGEGERYPICSRQAARRCSRRQTPTSRSSGSSTTRPRRLMSKQRSRVRTRPPHGSSSVPRSAGRPSCTSAGSACSSETTRPSARRWSGRRHRRHLTTEAYGRAHEVVRASGARAQSDESHRGTVAVAHVHRRGDGRGEAAPDDETTAAPARHHEPLPG